jgi:hypothetical protein
MTRVLVFDGPKGPRRFELLRTALMNGGDGKSDRSPAIIRKEARLLDTFDTISRPETNQQQDPEWRVLSTNGGDPLSLTVSQEDFDLLLQYSEKAQWTPRAARDAVDLWDWLSSAEKRD